MKSFHNSQHSLHRKLAKPGTAKQSGGPDQPAAGDVTQRHIEILESIASGAQQSTVLGALTAFIEAQAPDVMASVLVLDNEATTLHYDGASGLPAGYLEITDGVAVQDNLGSCGTAAFRGEPVFCNDLSVDKPWRKFREITAMYNLAACWSTPIKDQSGEVLGTFAVYRREPGPPSEHHRQLIEISTQIAALAMGRYRADQALRASEQKFATAFQNSPDAILLATFSETRVVEANESCRRQFGYSREELTGSTLVDLQIFPDLDYKDPACGLNTDGRIQNEQLHFQTKSGEIRTGLVAAEVIQLLEGPHIVLTLRDITDRIQAEQQLKRSQQQLLQAQELAHLGDWRFDPVQQKLECGDEVYRLFGLPRGEIDVTTDDLLVWIHQEDREKCANLLPFMQTLRPGQQVKNLEFRIVRPDGERRYAEVAAEVVYDADGHAIEFRGAVLDITARKLAEAAAQGAAVAKARIAMLTPREQQVLQLVAAGLANKVAARRLEISEKTVEKHRANVMKKMQVHSVAELVRIDISAGPSEG